MSSRDRKRAGLARVAELARLTKLLASYDDVIADLRNCGLPETELHRIRIARSLLDMHVDEERGALARKLLE